jgi:hypothetical protein
MRGSVPAERKAAVLMARPRKYPPELLDRGARLVFERGRPIAHVARDLGLPSETLRKYSPAGTIPSATDDVCVIEMERRPTTTPRGTGLSSSTPDGSIDTFYNPRRGIDYFDDDCVSPVALDS